MFLVEGLYKRIELLSEHLNLYNKKYNEEKEKLSKDIEECHNLKKEFNEFKESISRFC